MGKPQVTLTFAGDESQLTRAMDKVGSSAKTMSDDVGKASKDMGDGFEKAGAGLDNTYDKADALEAVGRGTADTMSGLGEIMSGNVLQGSTDLAGGVAALADGIGGAMIPALRAGVTWLKSTTIAQKAMNLAMRLNPIGIVITALVLLVGALVLAYRKSETFRNIVQGAMRGVAAAFGWILSAFGAVWHALSGAWSAFAGWVGGWKGSITSRVGSLFSAIGSAFGAVWRTVSGAWGRFVKWIDGWKSALSFGDMFDGIASAFKSAVNAVIGGWNRLSFTLPSVDTHIPGVGTVGGWTINTPDLPYLHAGGVVPGNPGSDVLAVLQAGERVTPAGRGSATEFVIRSDGTQFGDALIGVLRHAIQAKGGNVQTVLGSR